MPGKNADQGEYKGELFLCELYRKFTYTGVVLNMIISVKDNLNQYDPGQEFDISDERGKINFIYSMRDRGISANEIVRLFEYTKDPKYSMAIIENTSFSWWVQP